MENYEPLQILYGDEMDILTLKSKVKLGCTRCEKCCIYRGDIKINPLTACRISKYLNIELNEFLESYTDRLENSKLETVLKTTGELQECVLYDKKIKGCRIHAVKPMQCVMFPLVPENLKRDYFYNSNQCIFKDAKEITVNEWINGNNKLYSRNKKIYIEWIKFLEWIEPKLVNVSKEQIEEFYKILFKEYNLKKWNLKTQMLNNMWKVEKLVKEKVK